MGGESWRARSGSPRSATDQWWTLVQAPVPHWASAPDQDRSPKGGLPGRVPRACAGFRPPPGLRTGLGILTRFLVLLVEFLQHGGAAGAQRSSSVLDRDSQQQQSSGDSTQPTSGRPRRPALCASAPRALRMRTFRPRSRIRR